MTSKEKDLLRKDLLARLFYGVHCIVYKTNGDIREEDDTIRYIELDNVITHKSKDDECFMLYQIKPYLRPMSDMTEEERNEYFSLKMQECERVALADIDRPEALSIILDWLNAHHFDYRGLIEMGLALPAKEGMYEDIEV